MNNQIQDISIDLIDEPKIAIRGNVNDEDIDELAISIKQYGLIQPIVLKKVGDRYEVIAGNRRLIACRRNSMAKVPAIIKEIDERETTILKLHENLLRRDVNPVDEAVFLSRTMKAQNLGVKEIAEMINRSEQYIRTRLDILEYPDYLIEAIGEKQIPLGAAHWLAKITDEKIRFYYTGYAVRGGITINRAIAWYTSWEAGQTYSNPQEIKVSNEETGEEEVRHTEECIICRQLDFPADMVLFYAHWSCYEKIREVKE